MMRPQLVHDRVHPGICWKQRQDLGEELKGLPAKQKEAVNTFKFIINLLTLRVTQLLCLHMQGSSFTFWIHANN